MSSEIVRIAAKGDGVTADGQHIPFAVPGDVMASDGTLTNGPHHVDPPCRHFPQCGGCQLQHADEAALRRFVTDRVAHAAEGQGVTVGELLPTHLSPPRTRRRATLHGLKAGKSAVLGFREGGSHRIVDMRECHILEPALFALVAPLRALIADWAGKAPVDVALTLTDGGVDCAIKGLEMDGLGPTEALLDFAKDNALSRLSIDDGYGGQTVWEPEGVTVTLGGVPVGFPAGAFLQPTPDGEAALTQDAKSFLQGHGIVADLFSGLGTFAFALGGKVLAVEAARDAYLACKAAAASHRREVHALHRDLFRNPLQPEELNRFGAVLLDPPRAGAREQVQAIANSDLARVAYVSCNPSSWARDAKMLTQAGFRLEKLRPVGQFRWSTHVELTSLFVR
ncbi:class I SAM-dependent RNA methyltransferase [Qipengyuania sp.]|uniref:class I SAM-dependent RNA methyltransferase n=1 Tax=Qipengyuania sp. TaxID=2004515 RepID=UPI0035C7A6B4